MTGRRDAVLDAAVLVLGTSGLRALTHRAVDQAAGVPLGTTSNFYRDRRGLLQAAAATVADRWALVVAGQDPAQSQDPARAVAGLLEQLLGAARTLTVARQALLAEAACDSSLAGAVTALQEPLADWARRATAAGRTHHTDRVVTLLLEGLLVQGISRTERAQDAGPAARAAVRGVL